jgi:heterotetrameric sarcosine oxidase gamma subunit
VADKDLALREAGGPVARSPVRPAAPVTRRGNWEVSGRRSSATLRLADLSALAKVKVRSRSQTEGLIDVPFGRAERDGSGHLVIGEGPGEWLVFGPSSHEHAMRARFDAFGGGSFTTVIDLTHGYALGRLTGENARAALSKLCPVDLSARNAPNGAAFRTLLAGLVVCLVRDDVDGALSYLCYCERSSGQYLFDVIMDAGGEFGVDPDGYPDTEI